MFSAAGRKAVAVEEEGAEGRVASSSGGPEESVSRVCQERDSLIWSQMRRVGGIVRSYRWPRRLLTLTISNIIPH